MSKAKLATMTTARLNDEDLVARVRERISETCILINEADRRGIDVNFSINKKDVNAKGGYEVTLTIKKEL